MLGTQSLTDWLFALAVMGLLVIGCFLRLHNLNFTSLTHDEVWIMENTEGLIERGYPSRMNGPYLKSMTTYELVPFSVFAPTMAFGFNDFGARFHSVFWGTLQILLVFLLGKDLFGKSAGLFASAIQTFHPWVNYWSQNTFWPQMAQTWTTLTVFFLFKAMESDFLKKRYVYPTAICFGLTYLAWEGTGFLLVGLSLALVAYKAPDLSWLKNKHVWVSFCLVLLVVLIQQSRRILYMDYYLMLNGKLADLTLPQLFFLEPMYDPYFYINYFFLPENNMILTLVLIAGTVLVFRNKALRYLYIIILVPILCLTNLLPIYAYRYAFYVESIMIIAASGVIFSAFNYIKRGIDQHALITRLSTSLSLIALCAIIFFCTNTLLMKSYLLTKNPFTPQPQYRENIYETDYKSACQYIKDNLHEDDLIITARSYPFNYYNGITNGINADYSQTTTLRLTMFFDITNGGYPGLMEKYIGRPIIKNLDELKEISARYDRVWYVSAPDGQFEKENDALTTSYIKERFKVVYETYNAKVYFWKK